ncbi:MAG: hypothetical protein JWM56_756 [Candidatus Peribacteria bacterium]|nr:hypothetical protein [Candidatus Peribacteria bacterium]
MLYCFRPKTPAGFSCPHISSTTNVERGICASTNALSTEKIATKLTMELKDCALLAKRVRGLYEQYEKKKYGKSWSTEELAMGFAVDVGDLLRIIMAKEGRRTLEDIDNKLTHELCDCLWSILVIADRYNIDMEKSFMKEMELLETRMQEKI